MPFITKRDEQRNERAERLADEQDAFDYEDEGPDEVERLNEGLAMLEGDDDDEPSHNRMWWTQRRR
jgi:hypothetical protein